MHTLPPDVLARHDFKVPNYIAASVEHIDFDELEAAGIRHVVFDIDNTLTSFGESEVRRSIRAAMQTLRARRSLDSLSLATNSRRDVAHIFEAVQPDYLFQAHGLVMKPRPRYYREVLERIGANPEHTIMIGDKLVQDVWGSRKVGMRAVLVKPLGKDFVFDSMFAVRLREKLWLKSYLPRHPEHWF